MKTSSMFAVAALFCACRLSADTLPPEVPSASVSPASVDVTSGPQTVTITLRATDDDSGVYFGNTYLYDVANHMVTLDLFGDGQRTSGDELDGIYTVTMTVPQYARPGNWRVDAFVRDNAGNQADFFPYAMAFPDPGAMTFTVVNSGPADIADPVLVTASVSPAEVNVSVADATLTVNAEITDDLSGFDFGFLTLRSPDGNTEVSQYLSPEDLISGDPTGGVYQFSATLPQGSPSGVWTYRFSLKDEVGNNVDTADAGTFTVVSTSLPSANATFLAAALDAFQLPWSTSGGGWILQSVDSSDGIDAASSLPIPDDGSATIQTTVTGPGELSFEWRVDSEQDSDFLSVSVDGGAPVQSISGNTAWDPITIVLPAGEHTVVWSYAKDGINSSGGDRGYLDQVRFLRDNDDAELPVLQSLDISPRVTDLTGGPQEVEFRIAVTDDFNGVLEGRLALFDPSGYEIVSTTFDTSSLNGNSNDGYWVVNLEIPGDSDFGLWRAEVELTEDISNNVRHYGTGGDAFPIKESDAFYAGDPNAVDSDAPRVQEISVTPGVVDVTSGAKTAIVTLQITDPIRGFSNGDVPVYNKDENWTGAYFFDGSNRITGDEFNGIYQVEISIPAYANPGTWTVGANLSDNEGNYQEYPYNIVFAPGLDPSFQVTNSGTVDVTTPVLNSIDINPTLVDTSAGPAPVQVTVSISDDLSGLLQGILYIYNPANEFQIDLSTDLISHRISGDQVAGTYQVSVMLPQGSDPGQWRVRIFLRDKAGNAAFYGEGEAAYPEPGDGYFTVSGSSLSVFAAYLAAYPLTGNDALPSADPDHDGLNNATEVLLGTDPNSAASAGAGLISSSRDAVNFYLNFTIDSGLTATTNGDFLELGNGSGGAPLRLTGQTQAGLAGSWTNVVPENVSGNTYRIAIPIASGAKGFARLYLENP